MRGYKLTHLIDWFHFNIVDDIIEVDWLFDAYWDNYSRLHRVVISMCTYMSERFILTIGVGTFKVHEAAP